MATILATSRSFGGGGIDLVGDLERAGHTVLRGPSDHDLDALRDSLAVADAVSRDDAQPRRRVEVRRRDGPGAGDPGVGDREGVAQRVEVVVARTAQDRVAGAL